MSYTQLTQDERYHIQYLSRHCTIAEIAKQLNRHKSTISREIKRHRTQGQQYSAEKSQRQSRLTKQRRRKPYKLDSQLIQYIDTLIRRKLSPEQVCAYLHKHHRITLHHSTVYRYLRPRQKQRRHLVATPQNMQQNLPQTLRQHIDQRQSAQPRRYRKPTRRRRPKSPHRRLGSRHHRRQRTEKCIIDLGWTRYPLRHHLQ